MFFLTLSHLLEACSAQGVYFLPSIYSSHRPLAVPQLTLGCPAEVFLTPLDSFWLRLNGFESCHFHGQVLHVLPGNRTGRWCSSPLPHPTCKVAMNFNLDSPHPQSYHPSALGWCVRCVFALVKRNKRVDFESACFASWKYTYICKRLLPAFGSHWPRTKIH